MQLVIGIIIGIFLTIGTVYVMDSGKSAVCPAGVGCPMVNWDVANDRFSHVKEDVASGWHRLTGHS